MRHEAIELVCTHIPQSQEPPPHSWGVLGASARHEIVVTHNQFVQKNITMIET